MEQMRKTPELNAMPLPQEAIYYARIGWSIFPLVASGKIPYKGSQGYKDATTNHEQIQLWWSQHPNANIGLATGARSGVIVLDIDPPEGHFSLKELQASHSSLPDTRRSRTGNKGLHYFFLYPDDGQVYKNAVGLAGLTGVDIRATGGYVVLPPSKLHGRLKYLWGNPDTPIAPLPDWLRDLMLAEQQRREEYPQGLRFARSPTDVWLQRALSKALEGNRNATGFWLACQLRDDHIPEAEARSIILTYANLAPEGNEPYTSKEAIASVRSAYKRDPREPARRREP
jgi:Bifunctional DNA primase/polymerase, N-terminal